MGVWEKGNVMTWLFVHLLALWGISQDVICWFYVLGETSGWAFWNTRCSLVAQQDIGKHSVGIYFTIESWGKGVLLRRRIKLLLVLFELLYDIFHDVSQVSFSLGSDSLRIMPCFRSIYFAISQSLGCPLLPHNRLYPPNPLRESLLLFHCHHHNDLPRLLHRFQFPYKFIPLYAEHRAHLREAGNSCWVRPLSKDVFFPEGVPWPKQCYFEVLDVLGQMGNEVWVAKGSHLLVCACKLLPLSLSFINWFLSSLEFNILSKGQGLRPYEMSHIKLLLLLCLHSFSHLELPLLNNVHHIRAITLLIYNLIPYVASLLKRVL